MMSFSRHICNQLIVFVHGLQGHPRKTWACRVDADAGAGSSSTRKRSPFRGLKGLVSRKKGTGSNENREIRNDVFWPLDLLPTDCPNARILTFGYESNISRWFDGPANQNTIFHHAKDLLYALEAQRLRCSGRGLIFVVHSLGELLLTCSQVLRRSADEQVGGLFDIFKSTKAVLFLGTPHRGSNMAETGKMLQRLAAAGGFSTNNRNLNALQTKSTELEVIHEGFMKLYQRSPRPFEVVDDVSSSFTGTERCQTINANHMSMCRFMTKNDNGYKKVVDEIQIYISTMEKDEDEEVPKQTKAGIESPPLSSIYCT
ncbi:hypothetical protein BGZ60DRAFT_472219 [Tricladium varicosporioides]|nr:hypothetical protein BGZ60DRAFT_472219 [Hymenoscyphus varicosporioides]